MALFPSNPSNGDTANVNGYQFTFNSTDNAWNRTQSFTGNLLASSVSATGNVTAGNVVTLGNVTANYFFGNGSQLTGISAGTANTAETVTNNAQPNITSVGTLTSLSVSGNANVGNIGATNGVFTNISGTLNGSLANGNSNVSIPAANGNINFSIGGVSNEIVFTSTGANVNGYISASGNANVGNIGATNGVFTNVSGNGALLTDLNGSNITTGTVATARLNASANTTDTTQGRLFRTGDWGIGSLSVASSNLAGTEFNYSRIFRILNTEPTGPGINAGVVALPFDSTPSTNYLAVGVNGDLYTGRKNGAEANPTWVEILRANANANANLGNIVANGTISATGNITAANFIGNVTGVLANGTSNVSIPAANGQINLVVAGTTRLAVVTSGISVDGNVTAANLNASGIISATGNINTSARMSGVGLSTSWGVTTGNSVGAFNGIMGTSTSATWLLSGTSNGVFRAGIQALDTPSPGELRIYESANVIRFSANQLIAPALSVTGNIVGTGILTITGTATIDGNLRGGNLLTSGNANVGNLGLSGLLTSTGTVTIDGNVRGGNLLTSGNANVGNLGTAGLITATGNIQGGNLITSGNLLVGITTPLTVTTVSPRAQIKGTDANTSALLLNRNSADANPPAIWLAKDRAGGAVVSGDELGVIRFLGDDGTDYINAARIKADVDGTVSANNVPGRLIFETSTANSITPTERMRINSTGNISIGNTGVASYSTVNILRTNSYNTDPDQGLAYGTITANAVDSGRSYAWRTRATGNASAGISSVTESITRDGTWTERTRITSDGTLSVTGNVTANYLFGNGSQLTGVGVSGFTSNVGNASANSFTITHNLNKEDIFVTVREYSSGYLVYPDIKYANANAIILDFVSAPTANQYRVSVFGF